MVKVYFALVLVLISENLFSQQGPFSPQADIIGSNAIHKDSSLIKFWATTCVFEPGFRQINEPDSGFANSGNANYTLGKADAPLTLSLGDSGIVTLQFHGFIYDGPSHDFVVFENGFGFGEEAFLELAFVEVSSDGENFFRFPAQSQQDTTAQVSSFGNTDASFYHNLAGKYIANYGVPFDLSDLLDTVALDKQKISHVRLIDVIGSVNPNLASRDMLGNIINDPWPTNFPQGGFDLDALGIINSTVAVGISEFTTNFKTQEIGFDLLGRQKVSDYNFILKRNPDGSFMKIINEK